MSNKMITSETFICGFVRNGAKCGDEFLNTKMLEKHQNHCVFRGEDTKVPQQPTAAAPAAKEPPVINQPAKKISPSRNDVLNPPPPETHTEEPSKPTLVPPPAPKPPKAKKEPKPNPVVLEVKPTPPPAPVPPPAVKPPKKAAEKKATPEPEAKGVSIPVHVLPPEDINAALNVAGQVEKATNEAKAKESASAKQDAPPAPEEVKPKAQKVDAPATPPAPAEPPPVPETPEEEAQRVASGRQAALKKYNEKLANMSDREKTQLYLQNTFDSIALRIKMTEGWDGKLTNVLGHIQQQVAIASEIVEKKVSDDKKFSSKGQNTKGLVVGSKVSMKEAFRKDFALTAADEAMLKSGVIAAQKGEGKKARYWVKFGDSTVPNLESRHLDVIPTE